MDRNVMVQLLVQQIRTTFRFCLVTTPFNLDQDVLFLLDTTSPHQRINIQRSKDLLSTLSKVATMWNTTAQALSRTGGHLR